MLQASFACNKYPLIENKPAETLARLTQILLYRKQARWTTHKPNASQKKLIYYGQSKLIINSPDPETRIKVLWHLVTKQVNTQTPEVPKNAILANRNMPTTGIPQ